VKLLTWNIQWCRGVDGRVDPGRIARTALALADPDIVCLQEVAANFPQLEGSAGEDQPRLLAAAFAGYSALFAAGADVADGAGGRRRFGNMILSRLPVGRVQRHALPWPADAAVPSMPRVALEAVVETAFGPLRVVTTHLEYYSGTQRAAQIARLRELQAQAVLHAASGNSFPEETGPFRALPYPASAVIAGDFNMPPRDPLLAQMGDTFADAWRTAHPGAAHPPTFCLHEHEHGDEPYCCDYVFVTPDLVPRLRSVRVDGDVRASDHQPVIVELA
jgi:endonuclease/exonuclease/phosphatase family metal-dependent hydrolase